ncbi:hypothetical protein AWB78_08657 [Caballeronia calidae]|uniref:Uncharacterized protein n=1 Tax=Caballeronia calidae TaxID=1777139 RepID=A0A158ELD5_9BURK|nr:hypothetical protein AWB78_08657 [Caballeronia calidae]
MTPPLAVNQLANKLPPALSINPPFRKLTASPPALPLFTSVFEAFSVIAPPALDKVAKLANTSAEALLDALPPTTALTLSAPPPV